ncbi:hypothetical protein BG011_004667 [Mortierella polycephala]|uniref:GATA-type domain-containing protein n=1 Tax=Mortierella polycephala TaxID=41804 RepID=A0A9P6U9U6_9FUNG|nr:hypothetical protein BG011_004667 [Mortierella polycephala]
MSSDKDAARTSVKRTTNFTVHHISQRWDMDSAALHTSLTQSRQTWTHSAFSRFIPESDSSSGIHSNSNHHISCNNSELSLAGVCTVRIGPHIFLDTKFYTVLSPPTKKDTEADTKNADLRPRHQVAMEFKENPGMFWLFPDEGSLKYTAASDHESAQISSSFYLPILEKPDHKRQTITMIILQATAALWEELELAVKRVHPVDIPSTNIKHKNTNGHSHAHTVHDEEPAEILGSGKKLINNTQPMKRKSDRSNDSQKTPKLKRPKGQDDKGSVSSTRKSAGSVGHKQNGTSGSLSTPSQKRCGYCGCATTPMWRRGPLGPSTLCNACGVKWKHGKIMQDHKENQPIKGTSTSASSTAVGASANALTQRPASAKATKESIDNETPLYATNNLYTNNSATFPLHFPTISIAFGPNNAYYAYPNCAVILFESHFQIKLTQEGEKTEIDVWKEGIEGTEFQVVDVGDGESMIIMKALLRQYLTRFDKELLNPDRNESLIVFRFRERLDGGGPFVKPLLEHWLTTDIHPPSPPPSGI